MDAHYRERLKSPAKKRAEKVVEVDNQESATKNKVIFSDRYVLKYKNWILASFFLIYSGVFPTFRKKFKYDTIYFQNRIWPLRRMVHQQNLKNRTLEVFIPKSYRMNYGEPLWWKKNPLVQFSWLIMLELIDSNFLAPNEIHSMFTYSQKAKPVDTSICSSSPMGLRSQQLLSSPKKVIRKIPNTPFKVQWLKLRFFFRNSSDIIGLRSTSNTRWFLFEFSRLV